ncbi:MAG: hypothetical protein H6722_14095 [Sandaracinus sp.]|nr:hypothetical protein [Sandaracinus sp.]MCB9613575.1 hypothetical protein [Sandaracinus sp.]
MRALPLFLLLAIACGDDDRAPLVDGGSFPSDAGERADGGTFDAGTPSGEDGGTPGSDAGTSNARVDLTFSGCTPSFDENVVVVRNGESVAVSATSGGGLTGSVQVALDGLSGTQMLSSRHRVDTGAVINVIVGTTWTNLARDSGPVLSGGAPDPIGGTLRIDAYDRGAAILDLTFVGVTLQNPSDGMVCRVDGRLQTFGPSF